MTIKFPTRVIITEDYGKNWTKISFKDFYNLLLSPTASNSSWVYMSGSKTLVSWSFLQQEENYNNPESYIKEKISFLNVYKLLVKLLVSIRLILRLTNEKGISSYFGKRNFY